MILLMRVSLIVRGAKSGEATKARLTVKVARPTTVSIVTWEGGAAPSVAIGVVVTVVPHVKVAKRPSAKGVGVHVAIVTTPCVRRVLANVLCVATIIANHVDRPAPTVAIPYVEVVPLHVVAVKTLAVSIVSMKNVANVVGKFARDVRQLAMSATKQSVTSVTITRVSIVVPRCAVPVIANTTVY